MAKCVLTMIDGKIVFDATKVKKITVCDQSEVSQRDLAFFV